VAGHPHRFRDTFSVGLLEKGEDLRTVLLLLGHKSIKTTERHYAPYVRSFQAILDAAPRNWISRERIVRLAYKLRTEEL
jgi:site-specific recombinase XerD